MPRNLISRGNVWYVVARVNGKRISKSLDTSVQTEAAVRARRLIKAAKDGKWEVLDDLRSRAQPCMSLEAFLTVYRGLAVEQERKTGKPRPATVDGYAWSLLHVVGIGLDSKQPGQEPLSVLTRDLLDAFVSRTVTLAGDPIESERQRRSAYSYIRSARAVFSKWALDALRDTPLPDLQPFLTCRPVQQAPVRYKLPPEDLMTRTIASARATLKETRPDLYAVFLLCYDLGMRAGEAGQAQWPWIREQTTAGKTRRYMDVIRRESYQPKGRERSIPVAGTVWEQLAALRRPDDVWILPGGSPSVRENLIKREFADWMREQGWDRHHYPKAAHELRKLIGSEWYTRFGAEVASNWLGHADVTTTCRYYADLKRHPDPIEIE